MQPTDSPIAAEGGNPIGARYCSPTTAARAIDEVFPTLSIKGWENQLRKDVT